MQSLKPARYKNLSASGLVKSGQGALRGIFVASASGSPTITICDGISGTPAAAVKATQTLTASSIADGETVTIGTPSNPNNAKITYTFKTALSSPARPYEVLIGGSDAVALDNLKLAINYGNSGDATGEGTNYSTGTRAHPQVTAETNTNSTQVVQAVSGGVWGNSIATTTTCAASTWEAAACAGGLDPIILMVNTFIPVAATYYPLPYGFANGCYITKGGTWDITVSYD